MSDSIRDANFREALSSLLNVHSRENASDTPDFILARYLTECLSAFDRALQARETWYGRSLGIKCAAQGMEAGTGETLLSGSTPKARERGPKDAP